MPISPAEQVRGVQDAISVEFALGTNEYGSGIRTNKSSENLILERQENTPSLPLWRKLLFGMAAPPLQMSANVVGFFFSIFLLEVVHMQPLFVSLITFTGRAFDAITDPLAGQLVSKTNTRLGRSRPWMLISAPLGAGVFFLLWVSFDDVDNSGKQLAYYMCMYWLYCAFITGYHVPYTSSTMVIANNSKDKDGATAFRMAFELVGTIIGAGLFGVIINTKRIASKCDDLTDISNATNISTLVPPTIAPERIEDEKTAYVVGAASISAIYLCCGMIGFFGIQEKYPSEKSGSETSSFWQNIKAVLTFRPYLLLMFAFLFMSLGVQIVQVNLALYTTHSLGIGEHMSTGILAVLIVAIICIPFWYKLTQVFGKKKIYMIGMSLEIPCLFVAMLAPKGNVIIYYSVASLSGVSISVAMLLPWSMLPDVIDDYYLKTGQRREATFYSLYVFFNKFAVGISMAASQLVLSLANYNSRMCRQPDSVGNAIRYLIGPGPIGCFIVAIILIKFYPINESYRKDMFKKMMEKDKSNESNTNYSYIGSSPELQSS